MICMIMLINLIIILVYLIYLVSSHIIAQEYIMCQCSGFVYDIMKRTSHRYHHAIHCCKRNLLDIQTSKIAENVKNSTIFWNEVKKINPSRKLITKSIDNAVGSIQIAELLAEKDSIQYSVRIGE